VIGLPLTAVAARNDIERVSHSLLSTQGQPRSDQSTQTQAWIFVVGSIASTATTIYFFYILFRFPVFIQQVKQGGAAPDVVVRLTTFYNLNVSVPFLSVVLLMNALESASVSSFVSCSRFPSSLSALMLFSRHIELS
jgi:hypothetical protein